MKRIGFFISFIFLGLVFGGCHNLLSESKGGNSGSNDSGFVLVTGRISFDSNLGQAIDNLLNNFSQIPDDRAISNTSGKTMKGFVRATADGKAPVDATVSGNTYSLELSQGSWTITCHIFYVESTDTSTNFDSNTYTFEGEKTINVTSSGASDADVQMGFTAGNQRVDFIFKINKDTNITKFSIYVDDIRKVTKQSLDFETTTSRTITYSQNPTIGRHTFLLAFYDDNDNRIYTIQDSLYVLKGISDILYNDNSENYVNNSGAIEITTDVIQNRFVNKIFYVDNTVTNDTDRIGTYFDPLSSIQKAVNLIDSVNDGTSEYEIRLNTDFKDESTSSYQSNMDNAYICLKGLKKSIKLKICSKDDTKKTIDVNRNSTYTGRIISAWSEDTTKTIDLTLENLILKGGCMNNGDGGALVISAGKLTVDNCEFIGNSSTNSGGAINIGDKLSSGSEIKNTKFDGNTCIGTTSSQYGNGGAIYTQKAITFTDCVFTDNGAKGYNNDSVMNTKGLGGAIFAADNTSGIINGCTFIHNYSYSFGGAIYLGNKASITISENNTNPTIFKFNYGHYANAIYLKSCGSGTYITINSNVYFNNSENDTGDSDAASYRANVKNSGTQAKYYSNNDIFITDQNILFNYLKSNADELPDSPPSEGSNSYYADKYTYAVLYPGSLAIDDTTKLFQETNNSTNHLHKFIKCFDTAIPDYPAPYNQSIRRSPVFNKEGTAIFRPYASDLVQLPEKLMIYVHNQADLEQLLKLYENSTTSKSNIVLQTADITCSSFSLTNCTFRDIYDGQGYKISGLQLTSADTDDPAALFGTIKNAQLKNINIVSPIIKGTGGETKVGTLCGTLINSKIDGCTVTGGTVMGKKYIGGLVSVFDTQDSADASCIINSSFQGTIQNTNNNSSARIGGLLGKYNSTSASINIINCFFNGQIINPYTTNIKSGFIAGELNDGKGQILNCYVHGLYSQSGDGNYLFTSSETEVINCYADYASFTSEEKEKIPTKKSNKSDNLNNLQSYKSSISDSYLSGDLVIYGDKSRTKVDIYKYNGSAFISDSSNLSSDYTISMVLNDFYTKNNAIESFITTFGTLKPWTYSTEDGIHFSADGTATAPKPLICPALVTSEPDPTTLGSTPIWIRCENDFLALDGWNKGNTIELKTNLYMLNNYKGVGTKISKAVSFTLNGNNHEISYNDNSLGSFTPALISYAQNITIRDLTVNAEELGLCNENVHASVLVSSMKKGIIENCHCILHMGFNDDASPSQGLIFGGIVGHITNRFDTDPNNSSDIDSDNEQGEVEIKNCSMKFLNNYLSSMYDITTNQIFGGIAGKISGKNTSDNNVVINKCFVGQKTSSEKIYSNYYSTDRDVLEVLKTTEDLVDKTSCFGGIVGNIYQSKVTIVNCLNRQAFSVHNAYIGGIVGYYGELNNTQTNDNGNGLMILNSVAENFDNSLSNNIYVSGIVNSGFTTNNNLKIIGCCSQYGPTSTPLPTGDYYCYAIANIPDNANFKKTIGLSVLRNYTALNIRPAYPNKDAGDPVYYVADTDNLLNNINKAGTLLTSDYNTDYVKWKIDNNFFSRFCWDE